MKSLADSTELAGREIIQMTPLKYTKVRDVCLVMRKYSEQGRIDWLLNYQKDP